MAFFVETVSMKSSWNHAGPALQPAWASVDLWKLNGGSALPWGLHWLCKGKEQFCNWMNSSVMNCMNFLFIVLMLLCSTAGKLYNFYSHRKRILIMRNVQLGFEIISWIHSNVHTQHNTDGCGTCCVTPGLAPQPCTHFRWEWGSCWRGTRQCQPFPCWVLWQDARLSLWCTAQTSALRLAECRISCFHFQILCYQHKWGKKSYIAHYMEKKKKIYSFRSEGAQGCPKSTATLAWSANLLKFQLFLTAENPALVMEVE